MDEIRERGGREGLWEIFRFRREIDRERSNLPRSNY